MFDIIDLLLGRTGFPYGNEYIMSVNAVQNKVTTFETRPRPPSQKGPCLMLLRPFIRRRVMGMA